MDLVLSIQSAVAPGGVALLGERTALSRPFAGPGMVEQLTPAIANVLAESGVQWVDVRGIAVCAGPGSFSGVRIGCVTAQALAMVHGLTLVPVSTFDAIAAGLTADPRPTLVVFPARTHAWYAAVIVRDETRWSYLLAAMTADTPGVVTLVEETLRDAYGALRVAAPPETEDMWREILRPLAVELLSGAWYASPHVVAVAGRELAAQGRAVAPRDLRPWYVAAPRITPPRARTAPRLGT